MVPKGDAQTTAEALRVAADEAKEAIAKALRAARAEALAAPGRIMAEAIAEAQAGIQQEFAQIAALVSERQKPGTFLGDYLCVVNSRRPQAERTEALERFAARLHVRVRDPKAKALAAVVQRLPEHIWRDQFLSAVWHAVVVRFHEPQTYRAGRTWLKEADGRQQIIVPAEYFTISDHEAIERYLRKEVRNLVEAEILDRAAEKSSGSLSWDDGVEAAIWRAAFGHIAGDVVVRHRYTLLTEHEAILCKPSCEEMLIGFAARDAQERREESRGLAARERESLLSPRERQVYDLLKQDIQETREIASILSLPEPSVRRLRTRILKKVSKADGSL